MSVTFSIESLGLSQYRFTCFAQRTVFGPFADRDAARVVAAEHLEECDRCSPYMPIVEEIGDVENEMNVSNSNAGMLFRTMGMDDADWCGSMDASEFLGYVLSALGMPRDDSAVPSSEYQAVREDGSRGPRIIDCGLPEGYVTQRLTTLAEMATEAQRLGRHIIWG